MNEGGLYLGYMRKLKEAYCFNKEKTLNASARNNKTVGLVGLCPGAGATHLAIMLGNYYSNGMHQKTAIVSTGKDDAFERMKSEVVCKDITVYSGAGSRKAFSYKHIDFFYGVRDGFVNVLKDYYDVIIIKNNLADRQESLSESLTDILGCDCRILVGSLAPWKSKECFNRLERVGRICEIRGLKLVSLGNTKSLAKNIERDFGVRIVDMPVDADPFRLQGSTLVRLRQLLT